MYSVNLTVEIPENIIKSRKNGKNDQSPVDLLPVINGYSVIQVIQYRTIFTPGRAIFGYQIWLKMVLPRCRFGFILYSL